MRRAWTCDFIGCNEIAQWYRRRKGRLVKLCTKHEVHLAREHWGKRLDETELNEYDMSYLEAKERRKELAKKHPFGVRIHKLEGGWRVTIEDEETGEKRSFVVRDIEQFEERYFELEREGFYPKPSVDEYMEKLRTNKQDG